MVSVRDQALDQLEPGGVASEGESYLLSEVRRLRAIPLKQLRLEDLRLLIGQAVGLPYLVPLALEHLIDHPLASGDFYPGDLLNVVATLPDPFWAIRRELRLQVVAALERALDRIARKGSVTGLDVELRRSLSNHRAALNTGL
jgi:hypothetical protein